MKGFILVTGANGFVGQALCAESIRRGLHIRGAMRSTCELSAGTESVIVGAIDGTTDWADALRGVDVVIHLAARVHVMKDATTDPLSEFLKVNLHATVNLAQQAVRAGVKRFVYVSSVKVNGEQTREMKPFVESDNPDPQDPYAISKWRAEQGLHRVAQETGLEVVIVRPPLVYGPGVKGNFAQMLKVLNSGIPLPLSAVNNLRSLIYVENLVDAILACAEQPGAAGKTYLVSDGEDISTPDLLRRLGRAIGHPARLFPLPIWVLRLGGMLLGRSKQVERLVGSLRVDSGRIRRELGWQPPYTLEQGLHATGAALIADSLHDHRKL